MSEVIAFPDVEALLVSALAPEFPDLHVSTKVPAQRPDSFIRLSLIGGSRQNLVTDRPMVVFEAWAKSNAEAATLAQQLRARVFALAPDTVRRVREVTGPQSFPDALSEHPRYQFTVLIDVRGAAIS